MKLLQSFKILQNLAADLGPVLALLSINQPLPIPKYQYINAAEPVSVLFFFKYFKLSIYPLVHLAVFLSVNLSIDLHSLNINI